MRHFPCFGILILDIYLVDILLSFVRARLFPNPFAFYKLDKVSLEVAIAREGDAFWSRHHPTLLQTAVTSR